jgi:NADH dehydrogenase [ubiquinone] 1 alpha subcomplex assembly factor 6
MVLGWVSRASSLSRCARWRHGARPALSTTTTTTTTTTTIRASHASAADREYCIDLVKRHDRGSYAATLLLQDDAARQRAWSIRGFNVEVALIRDAAREEMTRRMRYQFWIDAVDMVFAGTPSKHPVALCLADTVEARPLTGRLFKEVVKARADDAIATGGFNSLSDLEDYTDQTVTAVLLLLLESAESRSDPADLAVCHVGRAVGIAGVLRAAPFLLARGEVRFPNDLLATHVPDRKVLRAGVSSPALEELAFTLGSVANTHLENAQQVGGLTRDAKRQLLPAVGCRQYLEALQRANFNLYAPELQRVDGLLPFRLLWHSTFKSF